MAEKIDRRIIKTKKAIRNALSVLMSKKDLSEITVKELADTADINRKTFYNYYNGVYQVIDDIENEIVAAFEARLNEVDFQQDIEDPYWIYERLTDVLSMDLDFYYQFMKTDYNIRFTTKIVHVLEDRIKEELAKRSKADEQTLEVIVKYGLSGMMAVYQSWVLSDRTKPIKDLAKQVGMLTFSGINAILEGVEPAHTERDGAL